MAKLSLSKSALLRESRQLKSYRRFLPSLDLKRRQLIAERARARDALAELRDRQARLREQVMQQLPMLANHEVDLPDMVRIERVDIREENVLGTLLPVLDSLMMKTRPYSLLARPHWVDATVDRLERMLRLRVEERIAEIRLERLEAAVQKITQRVNLFEKVLIPRTQERIRHIRIHLADSERAAVVRAKIAKSRRVRAMEEQP
ncbi:MAG: V-type ATP synthase subunit D [Halothiobacillaceae bacterium]